jgi:hypothetical protein
MSATTVEMRPGVQAARPEPIRATVSESSGDGKGGNNGTIDHDRQPQRWTRPRAGSHEVPATGSAFALCLASSWTPLRASLPRLRHSIGSFRRFKQWNFRPERTKGQGDRIVAYMVELQGGSLRSTSRCYLWGIPSTWPKGEYSGVTKQCAECHSMTNAEAPYCDACGYVFPYVSRLRVSHQQRNATLKGRIVAIIFGFVAAAITQALHA